MSVFVFPAAGAAAVDAGVTDLLTATPDHSSVAGGTTWDGAEITIGSSVANQTNPNACHGKWYFRLALPDGTPIDTASDTPYDVTANIQLDPANLSSTGDDNALFVAVLGAAGATPDVATDSHKSGFCRIAQSGQAGDTVAFEIQNNNIAQGGSSNRTLIREITIKFTLRGQYLQGGQLTRRDSSSWASAIDTTNSNTLAVGTPRDWYLAVCLGRRSIQGAESTFNLLAFTVSCTQSRAA